MEKHSGGFCSLLVLADGAGDYQAQEKDLRIEMARLQPGTVVEIAQVHSIVSLVQERVLPNSDHKILKENVLSIFGVESERELFPAPASFEELEDITVRGQYGDLLQSILTAERPMIISAPGGIGKSVFSQYIVKNLPAYSVGIAYDCFGSGKYRSRSEPRHRHRDALVQIVNELATLGLCSRIILHNTTQESDIMRRFLKQLEFAVNKLKQVSDLAQLVIVIDAADNAEMAAAELSDSCFAKELLKEDFPHGCKVVLLCRPERIGLLQPMNRTSHLTIDPFTVEETYTNLKKYFPSAGEQVASEFHQLTNGNPRVQMNAIAVGHQSVESLLTYIGLNGETVDEQIEQQLFNAIEKIQDSLTGTFQVQVDHICTGLASLPPNIPIHVLSKTAGVAIDTVRSFIADIGRPLWSSETSVLFRDEPTETWFRNNYTGGPDLFAKYIEVLEPLAEESTYIAQALPQLYLQAEKYDQLVQIALSDQFLPSSNPIDTRNVLVYRLQFALKAALRSNKYTDAIQLALRAGEEVAGDQRQQELFKENVDLLVHLQDGQKVKEIAFEGRLKGNWEGSSNVYSASLLSGVESYKGEASGYLRTASNWLKIYFEGKEQEDEQDRGDSISDRDVIEMALVKLNLTGARACLKFLNGLKPKSLVFDITKQFVRRLIDSGRFEELNQLLKYGKRNTFHVVAIVSELHGVGHLVEASFLIRILSNLADTRKRLRKPISYLEGNVVSSVLSFLEACCHRSLDNDTILQVLDYYVSPVASQSMASTYNRREREHFLKAVAMRSVLTGNSTVDIEKLMPTRYREGEKLKNYRSESSELREVVGGLLPYYILRAQAITNDTYSLLDRKNVADKLSAEGLRSRFRSNDFLTNEIAVVTASIFIWHVSADTSATQTYYDNNILNNSSLTIDERIDLVRIGSRVPRLGILQADFENSTYEMIQGMESSPEEIANYYIKLARSVLSNGKDNAAVYFDDAVEIVSKFGDEIVQRWEALEALGNHAGSIASDQLAYRFIRCGELVGQFVDREKHWNRSGVILTGLKMSGPIAISALSRWRDREIGRFEYQYEDMLASLIKAGVITSQVGWSMARLLEVHTFKFFHLCMTRAASKRVRDQIFIDGYERNAKEGPYSAYHSQLEHIVEEFDLSPESLGIMPSLGETSTEGCDILETRLVERKDEEGLTSDDLADIFEGLDLINSDDITIATNRFSQKARDSNGYLPKSLLWQSVYTRIKPNELTSFVDVILDCDDISIYECQDIFQEIPIAWKKRPSFKRGWPNFVCRFGFKYAHDLTRFDIKVAIRVLKLDDSLVINLNEGIVKGLSEGQGLFDAETMFGLVRRIVGVIDAEEANRLTEYAIQRFELHIPDDLGDGPWADWLNVSPIIDESVAGFIWSALGSPHSSTRWRMCHVVKKLADFSCTSVLDALVKQLVKEDVGAYGAKQFPFYYLHARQYLLISLLRISVDNPHVLKDYNHLFLEVAQYEDHLLIQRFARDIALNIESSVGDVYSQEEISVLDRVGACKEGSRKEEYGFTTDSYLHEYGQVDIDTKFSAAYDFNRYWYEPLGRVFGISSRQVEEICGDVIVNDWKFDIEVAYNKDPRVALWNNSQDRLTGHTHSNYPKTDNWAFYISYHSMMAVAAKLITNMPVINSSSWGDEDTWKSWLEQHQLTSGGGRWLADYRGELPIDRPQWIGEPKNQDWRGDIGSQNFLDCLIHQDNVDTWLVIRGGWTERHDDRYESFHVATAMVSKDNSEALLRALSACDDHRDYKIPDYEDSLEISNGAFWLKGFVRNDNKIRGVDEYDPYGKDISYPLYTLGDPFLDKLGLCSGTDGKKWFWEDGEIVMRCESWKSDKEFHDEGPEQSGMQLKVRLSMLQKICKVYDCDLILEVTISRDISYKYRSDENSYEYLTHNRVYLLSADGRLKNATEDYKLG